MGNLAGFDASKVSSGPPEGDYIVQIVKSETKPTTDRTGERLNLQLEIMDGPYKGQRLFEGLNIRNKNEMAQNISRATLKAICLACGKTKLDDSSELHNITFRVTTKLGTDGNTRIKSYKPLNSKSAVNSSQPSLVEQAFESGESAPAKQKSPWE